jgi:hypothetical protein
MFADAYEINSSYTRPLIIVVRMKEDPGDDWEVDSSVGAMVILNDDGWFVTASHVIQPLQGLRQAHQAWQNFQEELDDLREGPMQQKGKIKQLKREAQGRPHPWVSHFDNVFGRPDAEVDELKIFPNADLAFGKIKNFGSGRVDRYPDIINPSEGLDIGTSLCKLGYPFADLSVSFDNRGFQIEGFPPFFPIEGIYTRNVLTPDQDSSTGPPFDVKFIETSRPGLNGQSGGPIFDTEGNIWGIQSSTRHYPLGFDEEIQHGGKRRTTENAFLHVGRGVHPETLISALEEEGIGYSLAQSD